MTRNILFILLLLLAFSSCKKNRFKKSDFLASFYTSKIVPEILSTKLAALNLNTDWGNYIALNNSENLEGCKSSFKRCLNKIETIQFYNLGEIQQTYIYNKFNKTKPDTSDIWSFYDSKSIFFQTDIASLPNPQKGIYTIEYFLFSDFTNDSLSTSEKYKNFVSALIADLSENVIDLSNAWGIYENNFTENTDEGVEGSFDVINNRIVHSLEDIIDKRLNPIIEAGNIELAIGAKSASFLSSIKSQITTIHQVYKGKGTSEFNSIHVALTKKDKKLADQIESNFQDILGFQDELSEELPYYLVNDMAPILSYKEKMKDLLLTFKLEVFKTLDIVLTFGDNDGD